VGVDLAISFSVPEEDFLPTPSKTGAAAKFSFRGAAISGKVISRD